MKAVWPGARYAPHQVEGIEWMLGLEKNGFKPANSDYKVHGGILGDHVGLGKTIQSLALIENGSGMNTLLITKKGLRQQWIDECMRMNVNLFVAEKKWVQMGPNIPGAKAIYVSHYNKLVSSFSMFKIVTWDRIILDEAQDIRNTKTAAGSYALKLKAKYKWALTATPIINDYKDVVAYLKFIGFQIDGSGWSGEYKTWIPHIYLARVNSECEAPAGLTMPAPPDIHHLLLDFSSKEEELVYNGVLNNIEAQWRTVQGLSGEAYTLGRISILLRLRQLAVDPRIYMKSREMEESGWIGPAFHTPSRKFDEITHLMRESHLKGEAHRWIVFCQFQEEMVLLEKYLKDFPFVGSLLQYHGGMNFAERDKAIDESKIATGKQDVFLIQIQAGGTGLNLQTYDRIIFISPWWTSALIEQAKGRAVRIGQKEVVQIYFLKLKAEEDRFSIDEFMMDKADQKKKMAEMFLSWSYHKKNN